MNLTGSRKRKFHFYKEKKHHYFDIEIISDLAGAQNTFKALVKKEIRDFFVNNWKDFGDEFLDHSLLDSKWILLVRKKDRLIAIATVHKIRLEGKTFYNFKTDGVAPQYQSIGLLGRMSQILFSYAYIDNLITQRSFDIEIIFTTPNLRILGLFSKNSTHIYPNPYKFDQDKKSIELPDETTWKYVQAYNKVDFPPNLPLSKEACVIEDNTSEWPYICYEKSGGIPYYKEQIVNEFGDHYLRYKEGKKRMFIVYAHITFVDVIRYFVKVTLRLVKDIVNLYSR
ncbi:hypothetical protein ACFLR3_01470 [Campylobacterota bacterium]